MNFSVALNQWELMLPIFSAGTLLSGLILFAYIFHRTRQQIYLSVLFLVISSFVFVFSEMLILVYGSLLGLKEIGIQFHRTEQVSGAFFLFALPFFLAHFLNLKPKWKRINLNIAYAGLIIAVAMMIIAYTIPDLYISMNIPKSDWKVQQASYARGRQGVVYMARDIFLAIVILYAFVTSVIDLIKNRESRYLVPVLMGIFFAVIGAVDDSIEVHTEKHLFLSSVPFSRFTTGLTLMNLLTMAALARKFIDQSLLVERTSKKLSESQKKMANLIEANQNVVFLLQTDGTVLDTNIAFRKTLGYQKNEIIGRNIFEFLSKQNEEDSYQKIYFLEQMEKIETGTERVEFNISFNQKFSMEPKEFNIILQRMDYGEQVEILGNAMLLAENALVKYIKTEKMRIQLSNYLWNAELAANRLTAGLNKYLDAGSVISIKTSLREIIINAIEHGNMQISFDEKTKAQIEGNYFQLIQKKQKELNKKKIFVEIEYVLKEDRVAYRITDSGEGFDAKSYLEKLEMQQLNEQGIAHGRGIMMALSVFDYLKYNDKGNQISLIKKFS